MKTPLRWFALLVLACIALRAAPRLEDAFARPPDAARPWVFWFWSDGNVTKEGITADLEAMQRVGIGGVAFMEVDQNVPKGPVRFMSPQWRELFTFAVREATRLGLKIDLNNDAGWTGSGGPWIDGARSMQKVVATETHVTGPTHFDAVLPQPETTADYYRDIAILAYPTPSTDVKLEKFAPKAGMGLASAPEQAGDVAPGAAIDRTRLIDLTSQCKDGRLTWEAPAGEWTVMRVGHTSTGKTNYPSVEEGKGLEVDKLSRSAFDHHYDGFVGQVLCDAGPAAKDTLSAVHIDSWEVGYQNWTEAFRAEFQKRRGYDPLPWLPAYAGRIIESAALTERFLWDVRRTISELLNDNYAARMAERAHADGRVFTLEAYRNGPFDCLSYGGRADIPVGEFWMTRDPANLHPSVKTMTSVGHIYGRNVIAAEAFTASDAMSRQRNHPYAMKAIGDAAFCAGINHFIVHRYSMQPWVDDRKPGMTMGPWGVEYERTATWWEQTKPWHEYVARCQYLLQQGRFVADLCYLQSEEGINNPALTTDMKPAVPEGYDFDFCSDEVVRTRMRVENGRLVLPDGMSYRLLVLPTQRLMTPALLRKIRDLVRDGAVVFGRPPLHSPSLSGYPQCDAEVRQLVTELWGGEVAADATVDRAVGRGRVVYAAALEPVLEKLRLEPDFAFRASSVAPAGAAASAAAADDANDGASPKVRYIHRTLGDREVYFIANLSSAPKSLVVSLRAAGRPELWDAETGMIRAASAYALEGGRTRVPLALPPRGSVFVVVTKAVPGSGQVVAIKKDGAALVETGPVSTLRIARIDKPWEPVIGSFTIAAWVLPTAETTLPKEVATGTSAYSVPRNDVLFAPPVHELLGQPDLAGAGFAVGSNGVTVHEHGDHLFAPVLVYPTTLTDWTYVAVVFDHGVPTLYLNGEPVRTGVKTTATVYGGVGVKHSREVDPFRGDHSALRQIGRALTAAEVKAWMTETAKTPVPKPRVELDAATAAPLPLRLESARQAWVSAPGRYEVAFADGATRTLTVADVPAPVPVRGAWTVAFPAGWGAPAQVEFPDLISWSEHADPGVRYFSGSATYATRIEVPADFVAPHHRAVLDLGDVQVIAEVMLNGRPVATLWKPPFRVDVTEALRSGTNTLEVRVTNLWVNRLIGDEQLPADREWTKVPRRGGVALKSYPDWFLRGERSPTGRVTFATWKHYDKHAPLLRSGLLGPVLLRSEVEVSLGQP